MPHSRNPSSTSLRGLPARYTVPPMPPRIHRQLRLSILDQGILITPIPPNEDDGILIRWGVKGCLEKLSDLSTLDPSLLDDSGDFEGEGESDNLTTLRIGGILGIVRLWDAAYLLIILSPKESASPLFPGHTGSGIGQGREAGPSRYEVHGLRDIHAVPLIPDLAKKVVGRLVQRRRKSLKAKSKPKPTPKSKGGGVGLNLKWNLQLPMTGPGAAPTETEETRQLALNDNSDNEDSDDASDDGGSTAGGDISDGGGLAVPEADEVPMSTPMKEKRFSLGWSRFGKLGLRGLSSGNVPTISTTPVKDKDKDKDPVKPAVVSPLVETDIPSIVEPPPPSTNKSGTSTSPDPSATTNARRDLDTKIIAQIIREFSSGGFFYSFDFDLTRTLQYKRNTLATKATTGNALANLLKDSPNSTFGESTTSLPPPLTTRDSLDIEKESEDDFIEPNIRVPLWRRVDRRFFWNEAILKDFIDLGLHEYILPVMQGWVQARTFNIPIPPNPLDPSGGVGIGLGSVPIDLAVISRRSRDRAGLRYQRRGIDDEGHVANMVETEMIVRAKVEGKVSLFSFVQVRGSIPLKWSQSPYSMKPPPVLDLPIDQTYSIANLHFDDLKARYGPITIVNLSEQTGKEAVVTNGFQTLVESLGRKDLTYKGFDFHAKCHGMKWENISELIKELDFDEMGYFWTLQGDFIREQKGAFRTNCIDCLDRTNVVQSAIARRVLSVMLTQLGIIPDPATSNIESVFNDVWANNGDTLSLCYAHTSALKGDFVRTGKRDLSGMLHDGVSSVSRMFYGAVSDFFAQAVISFFLGHRNLGVFSEFLETLQSSDATNLMKLSRVRAAAIEMSSARVLSEGEHRLAGWTLLSPEERSVKLSPKLEEKILILTREAIYVVSFNYALEKVIGFTRIPLASITSIQKGAYILSPLQEAGRDPLENAGVIINFSPANESTRYSTYRNKQPSSIPNTGTEPGTPDTPGTPQLTLAKVDPLASEFFAFKILPREFIAKGSSKFMEDSEDEEDVGLVGDTCKAVAERLVKRVREACQKVGVGKEDSFVVDKDIVSLAEAQSATSILTRMDYAVKRFLWL